MPRIYKGNKVTMKLLIRKCFDDVEISELKIALFTNDPNMAIEFTDRYTIDGNIATLEVPNYAFGSLEDGVINYIAQGLIGDETFITERQSNYYLKTPIDFVPGDGIPEEIKTEEFETTITENGIHTFEPEGDVEAWSKATITIDVPDTNGSYDEGFEDGYNQGQAECPEGGSCNLSEGKIFLTTNDIGTYELYASDYGYDGWLKLTLELEGEAIKVHKASELLDIFNIGGNIDYGAYHYVGGEITEIQEVSTQYGNATYILDNGFKVYRGKWMNGETFTSEEQIKVGAYIVIYGVIADYNGTLQFNAGSQVIAYQECEGGEIVSCNLEDKWVYPSMGDRDGNGLIVVYASEGYDGMSRTVIDPQTIYNEGYAEGQANGGGEGGSCNLGILDLTFTDPYTLVKDASEDGYDGYKQVIVRPDNMVNQEKENAINDFKNQMQEITITENGTYSIDDVKLVNSIAFDGNSYFDTGIVPTEDIKIEVCIKVTDGNDAGMGGTIIGGGIDPYDDGNYNGTENRGIAIGMGGGAIWGVWGSARSWNNPYEYEDTTTVVLQKTDDSWGWESEKGSFGASTLYIGGYNMNDEEVEVKFTQSIVYIKIWTDRNDDSTLITYVPNTNGNFDANGAELQKLGDGTTTYVEENVNIYPNGFKRVEVNVPSVQEQVNGYYYCPLILGDSGFGEAAKSWGTDMVTLNDSDGNIIEDKLYVPTYGNRNEFRTKTRATLIQTLNNVGTIGSIEFGSGVEKVYLYKASEFTNLTKLIIGEDVFTASLIYPTFPILKEVWSYSTTSNFSIDVNFNGGGTLYLKNKDHETEWRNKLPSDWTIVYI